MLRNMLRNKAGIIFCMTKYIRKATRVGKRSISVVISTEIVDELKIKERQKLVVRKTGSKIVIEDWKK